MSKWLRDKIFSWEVKHLFRGIRAEDIILFNRDKSKAFVRGEAVPRERLMQLKEEAERFGDSYLWQEILDKNLRFEAQKNGMARKDGELPIGQAMILDLEVIKKAIKDIKDFNIGQEK